MNIQFKKAGLVFYAIFSLLAITLVMMMSSLFLATATKAPSEDANLVNNAILKAKKQAIQVNVFNTTQAPGLALKMQTYLRNKGFDVVELSSSNHNFTKTAVIDRVGDKASAILIARNLGIPDSLVFTQIDSSMYINASVMIGADFKSIDAYK